MDKLIEIALMLIGVVRFFIIAHFIMSWLIQFQVLNIRQQFVAQLWYGLSRLLDPIYRPIRNMLPQMGGIDLAPLVALLGLQALAILIS
ncbi:MAG: YggT family protein [Octadecabacter sp.]